MSLSQRTFAIEKNMRWNLKNLSRGLTETRFKLSAGLNLETFDTILSGTYSFFYINNI